MLSESLRERKDKLALKYKTKALRTMKIGKRKNLKESKARRTG
ncbi:hypothetical protein QQE94_06250 [Fervidobacterium pennivorans subsp. shakshaketiis]